MNSWQPLANAQFYDPRMYPENEYKLTEEQMMALAYLKRLRDDIHIRKFSWICQWDGRHRSGKSVSAIIFAMLLDKTFWGNVERRLVYSPDEILDQFNNIANKDIHGAVTLIDEAGASGLASTNWYDRTQQAINKTTQIFGRYNPIIMIVSPVKDQVSGSMKKMVHTYFKVKRYDNNSTTVTPYEVSYSSMRTQSGRYFYKKPVINLFGKRIKLKTIRITKPPQYILDTYEEIEKIRKEQLFNDFKNEVREREVKDQKKVIDDEANINFILNEKNRHLFKTETCKDGEYVVDRDMVKFHLGVPDTKVRAYKREVQRRYNQKMAELEQKAEVKQ